MTANEKRAIANYNFYKRSEKYNLFDAYEKPSRKKYIAWKYCEELAKKKHGKNLRVINFNTFIFTAGFEYKSKGKNMFMYITPSNDTAVEV